jgi:hypothetical protein
MKSSRLSADILLLADSSSSDKILLGRSLIIAAASSAAAELDVQRRQQPAGPWFASIPAGVCHGIHPGVTEHITQKGRDDAWALFLRIANLHFRRLFWRL